MPTLFRRTIHEQCSRIYRTHRQHCITRGGSAAKMDEEDEDAAALSAAAAAEEKMGISPSV